MSKSTLHNLYSLHCIYVCMHFACYRVTGTLQLRVSNLWKRSDLLFKVFAHKEKQKTDKIIKVLHDFTNKVIIQRREHLLKNNGCDNERHSRDNNIGMSKKMAFLDILLQATIDGVPLSNTEIREEVDTFMFAVSTFCPCHHFSMKYLTS